MKTKNKKHSCLVEKAESHGRLASALAHKVNNPLTPVMNYVFLLKQEVDGASAQKMLVRIERGVARATEVLNNLVDLSSPPPEPPEELPLRACIDEAIEDARKKHSAAVFKNRVEKSCLVVAGKNGLSKVIAALVDNSVEAGAKHVAFDLEEEQGHLVLAVTDDGAGLNEEHSSMVFEPYFTTKPGRPGLGLFASFNAVRSFGGLMWFESTPGAGARFFIALKKPG